MVKVTPESGQSRSAVTPQLAAANTEAMRYLAGRVGQVIEATVVDVTRLPPSPTQSGDQSAPPRYEIRLRVGTQTLVVQAAVSPRLNQQLGLEVLSAKTLQFVAAATATQGSQRERAAATQAAAASHTAALPNTTLSTTTPGTTGTQDSAQATQALLRQALREILPQQTPREQLRNDYRQLFGTLQPGAGQSAQSPGGTTGPLTSGAPLPADVSRAVAQLAGALPSLASLKTTDGVRLALTNSGLNLESRLARTATGHSPTSAVAATTAAGDIKAALLRIIGAIHTQQIQRAGHTTAQADTALAGTAGHLGELVQALMLSHPSTRSASARRDSDSRSEDAIMQLLRLAAGLTARVQSSQLTALSAQMGFTSETGNVAQNTALALPFWFNGNVELIDIDIDREPPSSVRDDPQRLWNLRMRFDLEAHGELLAFASLRGKAVAASLWASEARTMLCVNEALVSVSDNLNQLGLDVQSLHCHVGLPDEWPTHTTINLLDTTS